MARGLGLVPPATACCSEPPQLRCTPASGAVQHHRHCMNSVHPMPHELGGTLRHCLKAPRVRAQHPASEPRPKQGSLWRRLPSSAQLTSHGLRLSAPPLALRPRHTRQHQAKGAQGEPHSRGGSGELSSRPSDRRVTRAPQLCSQGRPPRPGPELLTSTHRMRLVSHWSTQGPKNSSEDGGGRHSRMECPANSMACAVAQGKSDPEQIAQPFHSRPEPGSRPPITQPAQPQDSRAVGSGGRRIWQASSPLTA